MILDDVLEKKGLKFEDLNYESRQTYLKWLDQLSQKPLSIDDVRKYVKSLREAVENELVDTDEFTYILWFRIPNRKHVGLKAQLKNYLLIEAFLYSHDKAKEILERQIELATGVSPK